MIDVRHAAPNDLETIGALDPALPSDKNRSDEVRAAVRGGTCWVAGRSGATEGYILLKPKSFFYLDFISLLFVHPDARRLGIATALFDVAEAHAATAKIFTSTNVSNHNMRALLRGRGYDQVGEVGGLDPGDPELFFVKAGPKVRAIGRQNR